MSARQVIRAGAALLCAIALSACMEVEQTASGPKAGKYQGKPDTVPWSNEPVAHGGKWTKGDRASWEDQINKRTLAQHEDKRIYQ